MKPKRKTDAKLLNTFRCDVQLDASAAAGDKPIWLQIARTGMWKGYRSGTIEFNVQHFEKLIANFRAHPWYRAGEDGKGSADVVPFDFDHASEQSPTEGDIPVTGAPAQAWVQELEVRAGDKESQLWALTRLLEPAKTYIADGKIKSTSVAIWMNAIDPVSGKEIGPLLTSVAFTNQPFIRGMQPIAARSYYGGCADSPEDALEKIRDLLGLSLVTSFNDVMSVMKQIQVWVETGAVPFGVDADEIVTSLRTILSLPPLCTTAEVFAGVDSLLPALIEQQALEAAESAANLPAGNAGASLTDVTAVAPLTAKESTMSKMLPILCSLFALRVDAAEEVVIEAARENHTQLTSLYKALGVKDSEGAASKVAELLTTAKEHKEVLPELTALRATVGEIETDAAKKHVAEVIAFHKLPATMEDLLLDSRKKDKAAFSKRFPLPAAGEGHLTKPLFATETGAQLGSQQTGTVGRETIALGAGGQTDVSAYPGRNRVEQCQNFLLATVKGADSWTFEVLNEKAIELNRKIGSRR